MKPNKQAKEHRKEIIKYLKDNTPLIKMFESALSDKFRSRVLSRSRSTDIIVKMSVCKSGENEVMLQLRFEVGKSSPTDCALAYEEDIAIKNAEGLFYVEETK